MSLPKIKIDINASGYGAVSINGVDLHGVQAVSVRARAGKLTKVFLQMIGDVQIEAEESIVNAELFGLPVTILRGPRK